MNEEQERSTIVALREAIEQFDGVEEDKLQPLIWAVRSLSAELAHEAKQEKPFKATEALDEEAAGWLRKVEDKVERVIFSLPTIKDLTKRSEFYGTFFERLHVSFLDAGNHLKDCAAVYPRTIEAFNYLLNSLVSIYNALMVEKEEKIEEQKHSLPKKARIWVGIGSVIVGAAIAFLIAYLLK